MRFSITHAYCREWLAKQEADSFDSCVTDPPYELGFMGKQWDSTGIAFNPETWMAVFRVLKPGAYLLAFGGTRTYHRVACAIEDAGFEIRDCLMWLYGSGFPKSMDVSKAIDKASGTERKVVGVKPGHEDFANRGNNSSIKALLQTGGGGFSRPWMKSPEKVESYHMKTAPATPEARQWDGWGTALKPAWEPIILARKPLSEKTVAANVLKHGAGAINVDACRIGTETRTFGSTSAKMPEGAGCFRDDNWTPKQKTTTVSGRWPANLLLTHDERCVCVGKATLPGKPSDKRAPTKHEGPAKFGYSESRHQFNYEGETQEVWACVPSCPVRMLDSQSGVTKSPATYRRATSGYNKHAFARKVGQAKGAISHNFGDTGGASRFFYCSKASSNERSLGLAARNTHPTVKPIAVMRWLVRLVTPPDGRVLEPFAGSGTTVCAALIEGFTCHGVDKDSASVTVARARSIYWQGVAERGELAPGDKGYKKSKKPPTPCLDPPTEQGTLF